MIRLTKRPTPNRLTENAKGWTEAIASKINAGIAPTKLELSRYRHPDIKAELIIETSGKCAYCESKLLHIHHGDVEHIYPKSLDPLKAFEWENLTLACEICNQNKSNKDPLAECIIDPYHDDPEEHFLFVGELIATRGTAKGIATREILALQRVALIEVRREHLEKLLLIVDRILDGGLPIIVRRALYQDFLDKECNSSAAYSAMARAVIRSLLNEIDPRVVAP